MGKTDISRLHKFELQEVQQRALDILIVFDKFCKDNNLRYMLAYGTCLGAVRHKGFIPWDDDVDVMMPRPDYMRLTELIKKTPINGHELLSIETNKDYSSALPKLYNTSTLAIQHYSQIDRPRFGIYIDIFVIDGLPTSHIKQILFYKIANILRRFWSFSVDIYDYEKRRVIRILKKSVSAIFKLIGYRFWLRIYNWFCSRYDFNKSSYAGVSVFGEHYSKEIHKKEHFEEIKSIEFCGRQFMVPKDTDTYLSQMYGDYMSLPPEEQRIPKHGTSYYDFPTALFVE